MDTEITIAVRDTETWIDVLSLEDEHVEIERHNGSLAVGYAAQTDEGLWLRPFTRVRQRSFGTLVRWSDIKRIEVL